MDTTNESSSVESSLVKGVVVLLTNTTHGPFFFFFRCNRGGGVHTGKYTKGKKKKKMAQKNEMEKKKEKKKREGMVVGRRQDNRTRHVSIQHRHRRGLLLSVIVTSGIFQTRAVLGSLFFFFLCKSTRRAHTATTPSTPYLNNFISPKRPPNKISIIF